MPAIPDSVLLASLELLSADDLGLDDDDSLDAIILYDHETSSKMDEDEVIEMLAPHQNTWWAIEPNGGGFGPGLNTLT